MSVSVCLPHPVAESAFMICRGLCACTEMLLMCVQYVSFGSKVRPRTFGCVAMGALPWVRCHGCVAMGALPWVVHCYLFFGPDCSYNLQGPT